MSKTTVVTIFIMVLFVAGCCNALKKSRGVKIPPYRIEYFHYDNPEKPTHDEEKKHEGWYEYTWDNGFQMSFKVTRVEESGVFFYRVLYRATNPLQEKVTLLDQNFELTDNDSGAPVEQLRCWNWQRISGPCNVTAVNPGGEVSKEIRFGFATDDKYARGIVITIRNLSFQKDVVSIDFYGRKAKGSL